MSATLPRHGLEGLRWVRVRPFSLVLGLATLDALAFLVIPVLALFLLSPGIASAGPVSTATSVPP